MVAVATYFVTIVLWKETAFFLESHGKALEKECCLPMPFHGSLKKKMQFLSTTQWSQSKSSVTVVIHLPLTCVSSMAISCHVPAVSMANGLKMCVLPSLEYLYILFCSVLWAAAPGLVAVLPGWDSASVSVTVTSLAIGFTLAHGINIIY